MFKCQSEREIMADKKRKFIATGELLYAKPNQWSDRGRVIESKWDKAEYRLETNNGGPIESLAVNVRVTGKNEKYEHSNMTRYDGYDVWSVRGKVVFVGDGEADVECGALLYFRY